MENIALVTGARSEYGILKPLIKEILNSSKLNLQLIVTGMHLLKKFGYTINDIKKDGFSIASIVKMYQDDTSKLPKTDFHPQYYAQGLANGITGFVDTYTKLNTDAVIVFGDRLEQFVAAISATILKLPIFHIQGGDKADSGHIDEVVRHSITKFAHLHFPATEKSAERIIKMGEEKWRVYNTGGLSIDALMQVPRIDKNNLFRRLGLETRKKVIVCIYHPVHLESHLAGIQFKEILKALNHFVGQNIEKSRCSRYSTNDNFQIVIIYPNNDAGSELIIDEINKLPPKPYIKIFKSLEHGLFINLLRCTNILVGNTSCGIIEGSALKIPFIHVGSRNKNREHSNNVIFVDAKDVEITRAINFALNDKNFLTNLKSSRCPYGDGKASKRIRSIIEKTEFNDKLLCKRITY